MRAKGLLEAGDGSADIVFTEAGKAQRQRIEDTTDRCALAPYEAVGSEASARLRELGRPLSMAVIDAGLLKIDPKRFFEA